MGSWAYGLMGLWAYGLMGLWVYGFLWVRGLIGFRGLLLEPLEKVDLVSGLIGVVHREVRLKGYIN